MAKRRWQMGLIAEPTGDPHTAPKNRCWLQLDKFDAAVNSQLKAVMPGPYKWNGEHKAWIFPLTWDTCIRARQIADRHKADINISDSLYEWATAEKARQETIPDVQSMELTDLPRVREQFPAIWSAVSSRPFQTVGAAFAARNRSCLIADQPGLGKTIQSIAAIIESGITGPILVVAPKAAAKLTWPEELNKWVPDDIVYVIGAHLTPKQRIQEMQNACAVTEEMPKLYKRSWVITSPAYLRIKAEVDQYGNYIRDDQGQKIIRPVGAGLLELQGVEWSAVVVDESHQTLPVPTGNKKKQSAQRLGLGALTVRHNGIRLALSGTPFRGKESYLWGQLNWLRPDLYRSYWKWVEKHFDCWRDQYGMQIGRMVDPEGMYAEARTVMIRRTKAEVAKDLPAKIYNDVWLDMEERQARAYNEMERSAAATLESGQLLANGLLAEMTRLKQFAGSYGDIVGNSFKPQLPSNKFDWLVEWLDERGIDKNVIGANKSTINKLPKVIVSSQFSSLINAIYSGLHELGVEAYVFTGDTSDKQREYIKEQWQNNPDDEVRVLLLTTTAGGVGLTLDAADDLILLDETWNPADQEQVEDRIHRLSNLHQVTIWRVRSKGTIEQSISEQNLEAETNIKDIIDGQRGVDFAKQVLLVGV